MRRQEAEGHTVAHHTFSHRLLGYLPVKAAEAEINQGIVDIRAVSREVGGRTKLAVSSRDESIDPVGACVGLKGSRVRAVVQELGGERIDIVPWHPDPEVFAKRAATRQSRIDQIAARAAKGERAP